MYILDLKHCSVEMQITPNSHGMGILLQIVNIIETTHRRKIKKFLAKN